MFYRFLLDSFELQEMVGLTKHEATFSSPSISRRTYCSGYDEHACGTIIFQSLKLIVTTFCKKRPSCDRVIKRGPGRVLAISAHKHAGKHMVSIYKCCLQFSNSRAVWESVSVTFLAIFCWIHRVTISEFHKWLWTIDQYRHHISGNFVNPWSVYNPGGSNNTPSHFM